MKTSAGAKGLLLSAILVLGPSQAIGQGSYADLKSLAAKGIRDGSALVRPPEITIQDGKLVAYLGLAEVAYGREQGPPVGVALLEAQMQIELIRRFRNSRRQQRAWRPYLQQADRIIREALPRSQRGELARAGALNIRDRVRAILENGCQEMASRSGLQCEIRQLMFRFVVRVHTDPPGASIWIMHALEPALAKIEGRAPSWEKIVQAEVPLVGKYWYFLKWSNGSTSGPELMTISSAADVVLR